MYFFQELKQLCDRNYFLLMDNLLYIRTTLDKDSLCKNLRPKLFKDDSLLIQQVDFSDTTGDLACIEIVSSFMIVGYIIE